MAWFTWWATTRSRRCTGMNGWRPMLVNGPSSTLPSITSSPTRGARHREGSPPRPRPEQPGIRRSLEPTVRREQQVPIAKRISRDFIAHLPQILPGLLQLRLGAGERGQRHLGLGQRRRAGRKRIVLAGEWIDQKIRLSFWG